MSAGLFRQVLQALNAPAAPAARPDDLRVAVAVLLVEAAQRDDVFQPEERAMIAHLLTQKFALSQAEGAQLLARAEATNAQITQLHPFTRAVVEQMDADARIGLIEMLWDVAYADGVLDPEEDALIRRLGNLIHVTDRDRVLARQRVLARRPTKDAPDA